MICDIFINFNPSIHIPKYPFINFLDPISNCFSSLIDLSNSNYDFEKYCSIIFVINCHIFRNFNSSVHIPKYPFINI